MKRFLSTPEFKDEEEKKKKRRSTPFGGLFSKLTKKRANEKKNVKDSLPLVQGGVASSLPVKIGDDSKKTGEMNLFSLYDNIVSERENAHLSKIKSDRPRPKSAIQARTVKTSARPNLKSEIIQMGKLEKFLHQIKMVYVAMDEVQAKIEEFKKVDVKKAYEILETLLTIEVEIKFRGTFFGRLAHSVVVHVVSWKKGFSTSIDNKAFELYNNFVDLRNQVEKYEQDWNPFPKDNSEEIMRKFIEESGKVIDSCEDFLKDGKFEKLIEMGEIFDVEMELPGTMIVLNVGELRKLRTELFSYGTVSSQLRSIDISLRNLKSKLVGFTREEAFEHLKCIKRLKNEANFVRSQLKTVQNSSIRESFTGEVDAILSVVSAEGLGILFDGASDMTTVEMCLQNPNKRLLLLSSPKMYLYGEYRNGVTKFTITGEMQGKNKVLEFLKSCELQNFYEEFEKMKIFKIDDLNLLEEEELLKIFHTKFRLRKFRRSLREYTAKSPSKKKREGVHQSVNLKVKLSQSKDVVREFPDVSLRISNDKLVDMIVSEFRIASSPSLARLKFKDNLIISKDSELTLEKVGKLVGGVDTIKAVFIATNT